MGGGRVFAEDEIEQAAAATMKMRKIEGTIKIADKNRKSVTVFKDMRLYNGYRIDTSKKSYAWIDLDSTKLIKIDADSRTFVQKNGKELDIILEKGRLFFDVAEPLADDEKMNIRTSTTAIAIRGTCGWIEVLGKKETKVAILEGSVQAAVINPDTGDVKVGTVISGGTVTCVAYEPKSSDEKCDIISERLSEKDVPGFVAVDIVNDKELAEKIFEKSNAEIDLRSLTKSEAEERLYIEEKEADKSSQQSDVANAYEPSESYEPSVPVPSAPAPSAPSEAPEKMVTLNAAGLTVAEIQNHLDSGESVTVDGDFTVGSNLTVPDKRTLTFNGTAEVARGISVTVNGTIKAESITGSVILSAGGQVFAKNTNGASPNLVLNGFTLIENKGWLADADGYSRYAYTAYKLDNGTLTIAGSGDYSYRDGPWYRKIKNIRTVKIGNGVTSIGEKAFEGCSSLAGVEIPSSVTSIGEEAFNGCSSLASIEIPAGVTSIGKDAFYMCSSLASIEIPAGVTSIGDGALSLGNSRLTKINVDKGNTEYCDVDGVLFTKNRDRLLAYPAGKSGDSYDIPSGVTSIDYYAFDSCSNLASITIPDSVESIGEGAFSGCSNLASIYIPSSVTSIGYAAFLGCSQLNSDNVYFGGTSDDWAKLVKSGGTGLPATLSDANYNYIPPTPAPASQSPDPTRRQKRQVRAKRLQRRKRKTQKQKQKRRIKTQVRK